MTFDPGIQDLAERFNLAPQEALLLEKEQRMVARWKASKARARERLQRRWDTLLGRESTVGAASTSAAAGVVSEAGSRASLPAASQSGAMQQLENAPSHCAAVSDSAIYGEDGLLRVRAWGPLV